jgi:hypothetical protein
LGWVWFAALAGLTLAAIRSRGSVLRVVVVLGCWLTLWDREYGVGSTVREAVWKMRGDSCLNAFRDGVFTIVHYLDRTWLELNLPALLLGVLATWKRSKAARAG